MQAILLANSLTGYIHARFTQACLRLKAQQFLQYHTDVHEGPFDKLRL